MRSLDQLPVSPRCVPLYATGFALPAYVTSDTSGALLSEVLTL